MNLWLVSLSPVEELCYFCSIIIICFFIVLKLLQVPGGPAHKHLEPGDVLVRVNWEVS